MLALEVVPLPVTDIDRALAFYTEQAGFTLDVDYRPTDDFRVVHLDCECVIGDPWRTAAVEFEGGAENRSFRSRLSHCMRWLRSTSAERLR